MTPDVKLTDEEIKEAMMSVDIHSLNDDAKAARAIADAATEQAERAKAERLGVAIQALGSLPEGYCYCGQDRDPLKSIHEAECRILREAMEEL